LTHDVIPTLASKEKKQTENYLQSYEFSSLKQHSVSKVEEKNWKRFSFLSFKKNFVSSKERKKLPNEFYKNEQNYLNDKLLDCLSFKLSWQNKILHIKYGNLWCWNFLSSTLWFSYPKNVDVFRIFSFRSWHFIIFTSFFSYFLSLSHSLTLSHSLFRSFLFVKCEFVKCQLFNEEQEKKSDENLFSLIFHAIMNLWKWRKCLTTTKHHHLTLF
jgi:hypothetical protein